jgi:hypothetical protein
MKIPSLVLVAATLLATACNDATGPTPEVATTIVAGMNPTQAGVVSLSPETYPYIPIGGVVLPPGSGLVKVDVTTTLGRAEPFARLNVYLLAADGSVCGQNSPEWPSWTDLPAGWSDRRTITGFRVYRLPCQVAGVRVILSRRRSPELLAPPPAEDVIVEATGPAQLLIRQD